MATLKGVFPEPKPTRRKNFIHENVKNLRRMENYFHNHKEVEELQKLQIQRQLKAVDRYQNITSRVNSSFREMKNDDFSNKICNTSVSHKMENKKESSKTRGEPNPKKSAPTLQNKNTTTGNQKGFSQTASNLKGNKFKRGTREDVASKKNLGKEMKAPSDSNLECEHSHPSNSQTRYKSQGIQTLDAKHMSNLYAEGTIRYPTRRSSRLDNAACKTVELGQQTDRTPRDGASSPLDRGDVSPAPLSPAPKSPDMKFNSSPDEGTDFIKLNKQQTSIAAKMAAQMNNSVPPPNHYRKGVVPKYLRERKEAQLQKEQRAKAEAPDPDCPEGHVPLPDGERKETLRMLKKNYQEFVNELNMMPIKTDTLRSQRRKMEIEKQLNKIEEGIKVFSRPKVYVKINA